MDFFIFASLLATGLILLIKGADLFIDNISDLGKKIGLSDMFLGITIVALGTSIPEVFVSISSVINLKPEIAIGNSIGSNIANLGIVFGFTCFLITRSIITLNLRDIFLLFLTSLLAGYVLFDYKISISDSILMIGLFVLFTLHLMRQKPQKNLVTSISKSTLQLVLFSLLSLILLLIGSELTVAYGSKLASLIGISDVVVGLTMVAIGTSLPELATSYSALKQKKGNLVIGNIIGSNILNIVLVFPIIGLSIVRVFESTILVRDYFMMAVLTAIFITYLSLGDFQNSFKKKTAPLMGIFLLGFTFYYFYQLF
ncbi:calcium/sodium antiporter [SAR86 cluster bacterium]|nr:calcium/sodium antiporter [SAR86 cluster bacterium]MDC3012753.1 calcium/sodium antiporter [SAR86 cluster bacterium]|tara:strand:+ start:2231 stop:3169 length:939 start_codon:yes stop_codon:yes gene_type:complete